MKVFILGLLLALCSQLFAVNLNTATVDELTTVKGIGESTAQKIVDYREKHSFKRVDEVMNIKGIGPKKFEKIKDELEI